MLTYVIVIIGLLLMPWLSDHQIKDMREEEERYEEEHKDELY